jgi:hypothetical protein
LPISLNPFPAARSPTIRPCSKSLNCFPRPIAKNRSVTCDWTQKRKIFVRQRR